MARGVDRDNPRPPWSLQWLRRTLVRQGWLPGYQFTLTMDGDETGAVTQVNLHAGDTKALAQGEPGFVMTSQCELRAFGVSWRSDDVPAGDWTLYVDRRREGESSFSTILSIPISTS